MARQPHTPWRLFGIPIHISPSWFAIFAFMTWSLSHGYFPSTAPGLPQGFYWAMGAASALLLFVCVLLHELGHSLIAQRFGIPVAGVTLFFFGGVAQIYHDPKRPLVEFAVAIAGPLVSVAIAVGCFAAAGVRALHVPGAAVLMAIVRYLMMINIALAIFNLLPGFPLDGGRLVRATLWAATGNLRLATRLASMLGAGLAFSLLGLGAWVIVRGGWIGGTWYILLGLFLRDAALASYRASAR